MRVYADFLEVWYGQKKIRRMPRLRGERRALVDYRDLIDALVRKPGAFDHWRHRDCLFPSSHFRMAYDALEKQSPLHRDKEYLKILKLAKDEGETKVELILRALLDQERSFDHKTVEALLAQESPVETPLVSNVVEVNFEHYDCLLESHAYFAPKEATD